MEDKEMTKPYVAYFEDLLLVKKNHSVRVLRIMKEAQYDVQSAYFTAILGKKEPYAQDKSIRGEEQCRNKWLVTKQDQFLR